MSTRPQLLALALALAAGPAGGEAAPGAIDWLTRPEHADGAAARPGLAPPGRAPNPRAGDPRRPADPGRSPVEADDVASGIRTSPIAVTPLGPLEPGAMGVLPPSATGLPRTLWAGSDPARLVRRIEGLARAGVPAADALAETLMLAEADPPRVAGPAEVEALLLARIDALLDRGALDAARALLDRAGARTPERRRRAFDVALLTGDETSACRAVEGDPRSEGDYARRVFCLVRGGDWAAGALTFDGARALGALDPVEEALLATFIDEEIADGPLPEAPAEPTPLAFRLYDALGHPVPTGSLPIAFARADLRHVTGWKAQLEASERLARAGAIDGERLLAIHTAREPSASGGVWDRVAAVQALDAALEEGSGAALARALPPAWDAMAEAGTLAPLAAVLAPRLDGAILSGRAAEIALRLSLLAPGYEAAAEAWDGDAEGELAALLAVARGEAPAAPGDDPLTGAVAEGFADGPAPPRLARLVAEERLGEALLMTVDEIAEAAEGDLDHLAGALRFLRRAGLEDTARRAALQLLILGGAASGGEAP